MAGKWIKAEKPMMDVTYLPLADTPNQEIQFDFPGPGTHLPENSHNV